MVLGVRHRRGNAVDSWVGLGYSWSPYSRLTEEHRRVAAAVAGAPSLATGNAERTPGIPARDEAMGVVVTGGEYQLVRPADGV